MNLEFGYMDSQSWNQFVIKHGPKSGSFLQSWGWGEFQRSLGKEVRRLEHVQLIRQELGLGMHYWYVGRGREVKALDDALFIRFDLTAERIQDSRPDPIRPAPHSVQPPTTLILDLRQSEEQLLAQMHEKTRYNIRVGERHGIVVDTGTVEEFLALMHQTSIRDKFRAHPDGYYRIMLKDHGDPDLRISLSVARVEGRPLAAAIVCDFGSTRTYLHGASSYEQRHLMAPHVLQWELIKQAKAKGMPAYDFWGIASSESLHDPLAGVTRFKRGFGAEVVRYPPTVDLILKPWHYRAYRFVHWVQRFLKKWDF